MKIPFVPAGSLPTTAPGVTSPRFFNALSPRYRYRVCTVRRKLNLTALQGEIYLDGRFLCNFLRIEYRRSHPVGSGSDSTPLARVQLGPSGSQAEATIRLHSSASAHAYQVEIWSSLEAPAARGHDFKILNLMGREGPITRVKDFGPLLATPGATAQVNLTLIGADGNGPGTDDRSQQNRFRHRHLSTSF